MISTLIDDEPVVARIRREAGPPRKDLDPARSRRATRHGIARSRGAPRLSVSCGIVWVHGPFGD